jgi:2-polyprenyl-6-methoxyphenol hydroxylase-like FAD-dependent oxidoreductase
VEALILGGGIAGPVTALALARAGIQSVVYEAWPRTDEDVGSYLTISSNGLHALRAIDAHRPVLEIGFPTPSIRMVGDSGRILGEVATGSSLPGALASRTVHRAALHRALRDEAERRGVRFEYGKRAVSVEPDATVRFADGTSAAAEVLVGADGIRSIVRNSIDPRAPSPRYVGLVNFGGYTPDCGLGDAPGTWSMIFGKWAFFGYAVDPSGGAVWFANVPRPATTDEERASTSLASWTDQLCALFADDAGPAVHLVRAGRLDLAGDNTCDLPTVPTWSRGRICILGDAAHAPSPSSGQGASMAIEDGVALALCLRDARDPTVAFTAFERLRRARCEKIVAQGARSSSTKTPGPIGRFVRDLTLPFVFRYLVTPRSQAWVYDHVIPWEPGVIRSGG